MKMSSKAVRLGLLLVVMVSSGCMTWEAEIEDMSGVYSKPAIAGATKIVMTDLCDKRSDKKLVGRISALNLATKTPINVIITNRIASRLRDAGFNVEKVEVAQPESKSEAVAALRRTDGKMVFTGKLERFFIESDDAVLEIAKARVSFRIEILDGSGQTLFHKTVRAYTSKHLGLGGGPASEELIEKTTQVGVNKLFQDGEFQRFLSEANRSEAG